MANTYKVFVNDVLQKETLREESAADALYSFCKNTYGFCVDRCTHRDQNSDSEVERDNAMFTSLTGDLQVRATHVENE